MRKSAKNTGYSQMMCASGHVTGKSTDFGEGAMADEDLEENSRETNKRLIKITGDTPGKSAPKKPAKNVDVRPRRTLFTGSSGSKTGEFPKPEIHYGLKKKSGPWTDKELKGLVMYIALYWDGDVNDGWPQMKNPSDFWRNAALTVNEYSGQTIRSEDAVRTKVTKFLAVNFKNVAEAEKHYNIDYFEDTDVLTPSTSKTTPISQTPPSASPSTSLSPVFSHSPSRSSTPSSTLPGDVVRKLIDAFIGKMTLSLKEQLMSQIFKLFVQSVYGFEFWEFIGSDFLRLVLQGLLALKEDGKDNLFYCMARCFGLKREESDEPRMPFNKMPFGLISYNLRFFSCGNSANLRVDDDYAQWETTMFSYFGHKWACLHRGPAWAYEQLEEKEENKAETSAKNDSVEITQQAQELSEINLYSDMSSENVNQNESETTLELSDEECDIERGKNIGGDTVSSSDIITAAMTLSGLNICDETTSYMYSENALPVCDLHEISIVENDMSDNSFDRAPTVWQHSLASVQEEQSFGMGQMSDMGHLYGITAKKDGGAKKRNKDTFKTMKAKVNVAGLGVRQIQRRIQKMGFNRTTNIQMDMLKTSHSANPKGRWNIKADAADMRPGLKESVRQVWSGDEDLNDGKVQELHRKYTERRKFATGLGMTNRIPTLKSDLIRIRHQLDEDDAFLEDGLKTSKESYNNKTEKTNVSQATLFGLAWDVIGYEELTKQCIKIRNAVTSVINKQPFSNSGSSNIPSDLRVIRRLLVDYLKQLYMKKRSAATHLMVFMISDEQRNTKPYAVPVRVIPFQSITDAKVRELKDEIADVMESLGMKVVGFVTDGEFNSLRTMGSSRPISIIQLLMDSRTEAMSIRFNQLQNILTPRAPDGLPSERHAAVPPGEIQRLFRFMQDGRVGGISFEQAIHVFYRSFYPFSYDPCPWVEGKDNTVTSCMRSLMAKFISKRKIEDRIANGIDFETNMFQPEFRNGSEEFMHEREDHGHVFKRLTMCFRDGKIPNIDMRVFAQALQDPNTGLTYEALTGKRKQSIPDCERIFSRGVLNYLLREGKEEAKTVRLIYNWHRAVDGRGIDENSRSLFCREMKEWLLDDWMPWHWYNKDYSTIDVNRSLKSRPVQGLTREVIVGLVANLESLELRRAEYAQRDIPPEHPRSGTTDDVEGFTALLDELLGDIFDLKQFYDEYPKILNEFNKRINPDLPFYYWTGKHHRYQDFPLASFNQPAAGVARLDRINISRRSDPGVFVAARASLPQHHSVTARATFHRAPEALPPIQLQQ